MEVADNTGASNTVSFASTVSEIDFELTDLEPVASITPMGNKEKPAIDIDETKNSDTSKEPLQIYIPRKLKIYAMKGTMHWRKLRNLKKSHLSHENMKENNDKLKYYTGTNVEVFDSLFEYLQAEKDIEAVKKSKKGRHRLLSYRDQLIKMLVKLRLNTQFKNLDDQVGF